MENNDTEPVPNGAGSDAGLGSVSDVTLEIGELTALVSDHAVALFDADGRVARWNEGARQVTGYDEESAIGTHYRVFFREAEREGGRPDRFLEAARADGRASDDRWLVRRDGSQLWVHEVLAPIWQSGAVGAVDTDGIDLLGYGWFVHDRTAERERRQQRREETAILESIIEAQPDILYAYDADGNLTHWNDRFEQEIGYETDELAGMSPLSFIAPEDRDRLGDAIDRILTAGERITAEGRVLTKDGTRIPYEFNSARIIDDDGTVLGFTGIGRDISDRKARERELERLERLNAVVRTVDETMVAAETREAIERTVVETFAAAEPYRFAIFGRAADGGSPESRWEPRAWAEIDESTADDVLTSFVDPPAEAPGQSVLETDTVSRYRNLASSSVERWQAHAAELGHEAVAVVPIVASERRFGVLVIGAAESAAFNDREREVLQEFGGTIGHAINAMAVKRLLYVDSVVELEFESTDQQDICTDLTAQADCRLILEHVLPLTDEEFVYYLTIAGASPEHIRDLAAAHPQIDNCRALEVDGEETHWELVVQGASIPSLLADHGARVRSKIADSGSSNTIVEASPDIDVRELVDAVTTAYPETSLRSKRTTERPATTTRDFHQMVDAKLTDKQRLALETAYYGGYFDWPTRTIDAGDIADRLGIARQTFHQHLRVAQEKLFAAYFDSQS
ncbi:PAS domain S-box protein [Salinadaptatus halalkaliphilus]|uniref:PAS domain S-box protein n=1 Tax=Salinadaptatus halalkaliphilus TaxID=2419781 RepID=A0A4S3TQI0_9EURY|nr:bacterio-opsin activator domain-containing protein [Salinadaptatus halalkaliphilus]THE66654.1 PAS domain S-box protein [Salinadaptatus halalkaliphilus]